MAKKKATKLNQQPDPKGPVASEFKPKPLPPTDFWRQLDILSQEHWKAAPDVTLIGDGGIGSHVAYELAKSGLPHLTIWDDDTVEDHNLPVQMFFSDHLGMPKPEATRRFLAEFSRTKVDVVLERYTKDSPPLSGIVISGVDSMAARKEIWEALKGNPNVSLYIEARMGALEMHVYSLKWPLTSELIEWYESEWYPDEEAIEAPCTARSIVFTAMALAGLLGNQVKRFVRGEEPFGKVVRLGLLTEPTLMVE